MEDPWQRNMHIEAAAENAQRLSTRPQGLCGLLRIGKAGEFRHGIRINFVTRIRNVLEKGNPS